jgi:hypothetical protein
LQAMHTLRQEAPNITVTCISCVVIRSSKKLHKMPPRVGHQQINVTRTA